MKTASTDDITLSVGLNDTALSPECTSTLIDLWSELQMTAVESVQAPTPNLFAFAETCFFFAIIMENNKLEDTGCAVDAKEENVQMQIEERDFERARRESQREAFYAERGGGASSSIAATAATAGSARSLGKRSGADPDVVDRPSSKKRERDTLDLRNSAAAADAKYNLDREKNIYSGENYTPSPTRAASIWGSTDDSDSYNDGRFSYTGEQFSIYRPVPLPPTVSFGEYDPNSAFFSTNTTQGSKPVGIVYLTCTPHENVPAGEANIGIILTPEARGKGYATQTAKLVLTWVFDEIGFHRVQAGVLDSNSKDRAITLFTQMGFVHEGTRRRSVFCPNEGMRGAWKDVTYLAVLDTDWLMHAFRKPAPKNLWDEMFLRHAREREELLRWDDRQQRLKRTSSMETVRVLDTAPSETESTADEATDSSSRVQKGKMSRSQASQSPPPSDSDLSTRSWETGGWESDEDEGLLQHSPFINIPRRPSGDASSSSSSSSYGSPESVPRSSSSPSGSQWDMLETSSASSLGFESADGEE